MVIRHFNLELILSKLPPDDFFLSSQDNHHCNMLNIHATLLKQSLGRNATQHLTTHVEPHRFSHSKLSFQFVYRLPPGRTRGSRIASRGSQKPWASVFHNCCCYNWRCCFSSITKSAPTVRARQKVISENSTNRKSRSLEQHYHKVKRSMVMGWWELWPNNRTNINKRSFPTSRTGYDDETKFKVMFICAHITHRQQEETFALSQTTHSVVGLGYVEGWSFTLIFDKIWSSANKIHRTWHKCEVSAALIKWFLWWIFKH